MKFTTNALGKLMSDLRQKALDYHALPTTGTAFCGLTRTALAP